MPRGASASNTDPPPQRHRAIPERRPAVAAGTRLRPTRDALPRSSTRVSNRRLGNYANSVSPAGQAGDLSLRRRGKRRKRGQLRHQIRGTTTLSRLQDCGAKTVNGLGGPILRVSGEGDERIAGYAGLVTCGPGWACPCCSAKIAARRAEELCAVMRTVLTSGGSASLITLTMRHHSGQRHKALWHALSA